MKVNSNLSLRDWGNDLSKWDTLSQRTNSLITEVDDQTLFEHNKYYEFFKTFPPIDEVKKTLSTNSDSLSPFSKLIHSNHDFYRKYFIDELIEFILEIYDISDVSQRFLLRGYLNRLDNHNQKLNQENKTSIFKYFGDNKLIDYTLTERSGLLSDLPVKEVVAYSILNTMTPLKVLKKCGIHLDSNSHFFNRLETQHTLELLKTISLDNTHPVSEEIIKKKIYFREFTKPELVGHQIIKIILDHPSEKHESWTKMIIEFAGDPRSKEGVKYRKWWKFLGEKYIKSFEKLLSKLDILLFLEALQQFAREKDSDMERMFSSRKKFLTGLATQNLIKLSRLFLPFKVKNYIQKNQSKIDLSYVCDLSSGGNTSVIYLQVGPFHILEGSHNCKIRVSHDPQKKLSSSDFLDIDKIEYSHLITKLGESIEGDRSENCVAQTHHPGGRWKMRVVNFIQRKLPNLKTSLLFTEEENDRFRPEDP